MTVHLNFGDIYWKCTLLLRCPRARSLALYVILRWDVVWQDKSLLRTHLALLLSDDLVLTAASAFFYLFNNLRAANSRTISNFLMYTSEMQQSNKYGLDMFSYPFLLPVFLEIRRWYPRWRYWLAPPTIYCLLPRLTP